MGRSDNFSDKERQYRAQGGTPAIPFQNVVCGMAGIFDRVVGACLDSERLHESVQQIAPRYQA